MSKKDLLGSGASFSSARRPSERSERGRAKAMAQGEIPVYELARFRLDQVSPTPLNPRRNFGTAEELTRFGEELRQAQLAACVAVSRSAYLALWPDHEAAIGAAEYVLINGERRYRSAAHVGLEGLDFVVRDELARTREDFIDHLLAENLEREDFDVVERARGVAQLVAICAEAKEFGSKSRAAERLGKSPAWITHQLALLELPDEIQAMLSSGDMPERDGRALARALKDDPSLKADELLALLRSTKEKEAQVKEKQHAILQAAAESASAPAAPHVAVALPSPSPSSEQPVAAGTSTLDPLTAVKGSASSPTTSIKQPEGSTATATAPRPPTNETPPNVVPRQAAEVQTALAATGEVEVPADAEAEDAGFLVDVRALPRVPWHDGEAVAQLLFQKMDREQLAVLLEKLLDAHTGD
ncbi:ParB/RepB/Spo0J family partition protein [Streptomyces sp. NBC_01264]|uniref:ParB/RepB/Spo0J family partition protein n=1 Tax=Streptomyces sp. NBC_01264 TaxID=2903804 RepID=UPI002258286B|nr:ParB/RepB/Spo0J family partition protein [Streptomyces sp. NBC_01264]MCX4784233.1 ParB/RepB/Spo0J family partition protein [Streptomyces sp. NBC_01264]